MKDYDRIKAEYERACAWLDAHPEIPRKFVMGRVPPGVAQIAEAQKKEAELELRKLKKAAKDLEPKRSFKRRRRR